MFSLTAKFSRRSYSETACFTTNVNSIYALAISHDGHVLAGGGSDGIKLWNMNTHRELESSGTNQDVCGAVSCATWIKPRNGGVETLCYGTGLGYLVFLRPSPADKIYQEICARRLGAGFEVTCLAWDASSSEGGARIAVGMRDNVVQILLFNTHSQLQSVFAGRLDTTVPKSIAFVDRDEVCIFGLFDGNIIRMKASDGTVLAEHRCNSVIGYAAVNMRRRLTVIDNMANGFTLYRLDCADPIRTYLTDPPTVPVPKQVAFGEDSKLVIGGSDNGRVYLFNRKSGELLSTLRHSKAGLVQSIAVRDVDGHCIIASASPTSGRKCVTIKVWTHNYIHKTDPSTQCSLTYLLRVLVRLTVLLAFMGFFKFGTKIGLSDAAEWAIAHAPRISQWYIGLHEKHTHMRHSSPAGSNPNTVQQKEHPVMNNAPAGASAATLEELAQHFMDLAWMADRRVFDPAYRKARHEVNKKDLPKVEVEVEDVHSETSIIYL